MLLLDLDLDVLHVISTHLDRGDVLSMMQTCRSLYTDGSIHLLRFPVDLVLDEPSDLSERKIASFCQFMLASTPMRPSCLRELSFGAYHFCDRPSLAEAFAAVLRDAPNLQTLNVQDCHAVIHRLPQIASALTSLRILKHLTLEGCIEEIHDLVRQIRAPLLSLSLHRTVGSSGPELDFAPHLCQFSDTLKKLDVSDIAFGLSGHQFFNVKELVAYNCWYTDIAPLVHCFPNLRTFQQDDDGFDEPALTAAEVEDLRLANIAAQVVHKWQHMERIEGDLRFTYILSPMCHVRLLELSFYDITMAHMLDPLVWQTTPSHLLFTIHIGRRGQWGIDIRDVPNLLRQAHHQLRLFTLSFHIYYGLDNIDDLLRRILSFFAFLPSLARLKVCIRCIEPQRSASQSQESPYHPPHQYNAIRQLDHPSFARRLMQGSPSLRYVGLEISGTILSSSGFHVVESESGTREVQKLPGGIEMELEDDLERTS